MCFFLEMSLTSTELYWNTKPRSTFKEKTQRLECFDSQKLLTRFIANAADLLEYHLH